jgi:hypothetical protein
MEILAEHYKVGEMTNSIAMSEQYVTPTAQSLAGSAHLFADGDNFYKKSDVVFQIPQTLSPPLRPLEVFHSDVSRSSSLGSIGAFYNQVDAPIMYGNNDFGCKRSELPIRNTPRPCPTGCMQEDAAQDSSVLPHAYLHHRNRHHLHLERKRHFSSPLTTTDACPRRNVIRQIPEQI